MNKFGAAKLINYERVWRAAMTIEYLAQTETSALRRPGEDLLIELIQEQGRQTTQSIGYVALRSRKYHNLWPVLTTIEPANEVRRDVLTLVEGDATQEIFYADCRQTNYGAEVLGEYADRLGRIEQALRNPAVRHYVEFERPGAYNLDC
jgi:hypothetical protein